MYQMKKFFETMWLQSSVSHTWSWVRPAFPALPCPALPVLDVSQQHTWFKRMAQMNRDIKCLFITVCEIHFFKYNFVKRIFVKTVHNPFTGWGCWESSRKFILGVDNSVNKLGAIRSVQVILLLAWGDLCWVPGLL